MEKHRVGLISLDRIGSKMAGPGIRYLELGRELAKEYDVVLFVPDSTDIKEHKLKIIPYNSKKSSDDISKKIHDLDIIIAQSLRPLLVKKIKSLGIRYIVDLYDPLTIEVLEYTKDDKQALRESTFDFNYYSLAISLLAADHIICASETQKDYYIGFLSGQKLLSPKVYSQNPSLDDFISIAPFGMKEGKARAKDKDIFFRKFPGIDKTDKIVYWGGGIWNWFDPISVIKAIEKISKKRQDIKLFFLGVKHPNPKIKAMQTANEALEYVKKQGLLDKYVFFNFDWTPYDERVNYLGLSTIGISTHFNNIETRFSFRTRILDYLWAEIPMVLTRGDTFAKLCEKENLGIVVDYENSNQIADAIEKIVDDKHFYQEITSNIKRVKNQFRWSTIAKTISDIISENKYIIRNFQKTRFLTKMLDFYLAGIRKKLAK